MVDKIFEALKQGYGKGSKLGLADSVLRGVATSLSTLIKNEDEIASVVEGSESLLKNIQSSGDKVRTELSAELKALKDKNAELELKLKDIETTPSKDEIDDVTTEKMDIAEIVAQAVATAIKPISEELSQFKGEQAAKTVYNNAEALFKSNDYVKRFNTEATDAWDRANELYDATGRKWSAEDFNKKAMEYFNKLVARKGIDTSKALEAEPSNDNLDVDKIKAILQDSGRLTKEEN